MEEKQLQQLAATVRAQAADSLIIVVGDFNIPRGGQVYDDFLASSGLTDPLAADLRPTNRLPAWIPACYSLPIDYVLVRTREAQSFKIDCGVCFSSKYRMSGRH